MSHRIGFGIVILIIASLLSTGAWPAPSAARAGVSSTFLDASFDRSEKPKKKRKKKRRKKRASKKQKKDGIIRWGKRRKETNKKYDKRYKLLLRQIKQDKKGDITGGDITNGTEQIRMWTYHGFPFLVRTDIDAKFAADTAMYMEMLHREYGAAYKRFLGVKAKLGEPIEVIIFADRDTYIKNGGSEGSGGFFTAFVHLRGDRAPFWKAKHYRLQMFTDGIKKFAEWPKATLKHEAAHMELQLRLGMKGDPRFGGFGIPIQGPRWFNEGHASVFEYWDFDRSVDENLAVIDNRGRYAPVIRRLHGTDRWKDFEYVWTIDPKTWSEDMTSTQGFLNYAQAWSLCAYMMNGGVDGRRDFRSVFDLSKRVGADRQDSIAGDGLRAWAEKFPEEAQEELEKNWNDWVARNVSRKRKVPDEEYYLRRSGFDPSSLEKLVSFSTKESAAENALWIQEQQEHRKKNKKIEK